ncbi:hypothetical protein GA0074692_4996 [Micromonospora pallida]|uniref:Uncharacterized protein n=1 Tax=Micromonospora pallida TaxID=145854 RepID=A0A1C6TA54_9ACTN|nr:hypothetical protein [Micromonospora pallida]SCL38393.1 hypothetical protein GA0074692_4996 [Micromonospora pallida]
MRAALVGDGPDDGTQVEPDGSEEVSLGVGVGSCTGSGDSVGVGVVGVGEVVGRGVRDGTAPGGDGDRPGGTSGPWDADGDGPMPVTAPATGEEVGASTTDGDDGRTGPTTTGPREGVGMNGTSAFGSEVPPTVAEPALIAARIGMEAVPASSATVNR